MSKMAKMLLPLILSILALHGVSASPFSETQSTTNSILKGSKDGMYMVTINDELIYMGPHNETLLTEYTTAATPATRHEEHTINRRTGDGVFCDPSSKAQMEENDIVKARLFMAAWFYDNKCFNSKSIVSVYGGAASFACNYQKQACQTDAGYIDDGEAVDEHCGETYGGWYGHGDPNRNSFGRTAVGNSYC